MCRRARSGSAPPRPLTSCTCGSNTSGAITGLAVQNLGNTNTSYSGMLFYDQFGALGQFQGFNNVTHEYRINNIASNASINFMLGACRSSGWIGWRHHINAPRRLRRSSQHRPSNQQHRFPGDFGQNTNPTGTGIFVNSTGSAGISISNTNATGAGIYALAPAGNGVFGSTDTGTAVTGFAEMSGDGVLGSTDTETAITGIAESAAGFAGVFRRRAGARHPYESAGAFRIDHPLDPENKYLSHSFVESPDMKNIYDGVAVFDGAGEAIVALPDWFEALNGDFRYQLTPMGAAFVPYIADEIAGNQFKIAGGVSGRKVSWQVTGIRRDAFANANRIQVEEMKPSAALGTYCTLKHSDRRLKRDAPRPQLRIRRRRQGPRYEES